MTKEEAEFLETFLKGNYYAYLLSFYKDTIKEYRYIESMSKNEAFHRIKLLNELYEGMNLHDLGPKFFSNPDDAPVFDFDLEKAEAEKADNVFLFNQYTKGQ